MSLLFSLLSAPASAVVYTGNPSLDFRVDRVADDYISGDVVLDKVRVHHCGGGSTDVQVDETVDPVAGVSVSIPSGNHCGLTFYWDSALDIEGPSYVVRYSQATTAVTLDEDIAPVALTPYSVISGTMSGGGPWLLMSID